MITIGTTIPKLADSSTVRARESETIHTIRVAESRHTAITNNKTTPASYNF